MTIVSQFIDAVRQRRITPKTILDIGAHDGRESCTLSRAFPRAHVHSFEAHPSFQDACGKAIKGDSAISLHRCAVGDMDGSVPFYVVDTSQVPKDPGASSLLRSNGQFDDVLPLPQRETRVQSVRLDTWARQHNVAACDALWMDVQGAELKVLEGMGQLLDTVEAICLEVTYRPMYIDQPLYSEVDHFLSDHGFCCIYHQVAAKYWWGDAIYVRRERATLPKSTAGDFDGRISEVLSDPTNLLLPRVEQAGWTINGKTTMRNGVIVHPMYGYYGKVIEAARGTHEPQQEYVFDRLTGTLPEGATMIELGAWWSFYALSFAQLIPRARCVLVEPNPDRLNLSSRNFQLNGYNGEFVDKRISSEYTLEALFDDLRVNFVDVLHADIDGAEESLLFGASDILNRHMVGCVFLSTHSQGLHDRCKLALQHHGYQIIAEADFEHGTYFYDGLLVACGRRFPSVAPVLLPQREGRTRLSD